VGRRLKEAFSRLLHSEMQGPDERKQTFILYNYRDSKLPSSLASSPGLPEPVPAMVTVRSGHWLRMFWIYFLCYFSVVVLSTGWMYDIRVQSRMKDERRR
jgi:hypothetical protein